ncbi:MAG: TetR/AcrR family transcriptional regulator [Pseudomonadota bacterium]
MSPRPSDGRQRVVAAAADMLARHGLNATSIREMAKRAEAPLGSTYHHFPGGKQQVIREAVLFAGARVSAGLNHHLQTGVAEGLRAFLAIWRDILLRSAFRQGCPVLAAAVEEPVDDTAEEALAASAQVFTDWRASLAAALEKEGHAPASAASLATLVIASVEGAVVLCRAQRSIEPFDQVAAQLEHWLASQGQTAA